MTPSGKETKEKGRVEGSRNTQAGSLYHKGHGTEATLHETHVSLGAGEGLPLSAIPAHAHLHTS